MTSALLLGLETTKAAPNHPVGQSERGLAPAESASQRIRNQEQPLVAPQLMHFRQEPLRTIVIAPQSPQASPS